MVFDYDEKFLINNFCYFYFILFSVNCVTATYNNHSDINNIDLNNPLNNDNTWIIPHTNKLNKLCINLNLTYNQNPKSNVVQQLDNNLTVNDSSNIHHNKSNLVNLNTDKDKPGINLFNDTLHNQNQYNKTFKLLGLNHSVNNGSIFNNKELNTSKLNNSICDDFREDNFLINPVPKSDNKDYNILLLILPFLLVLLGAIILYKKKIR